MAHPEMVSEQEWARARGDLLTAEKEATRALDALAARRRRLPMVKFGEYVFAAAERAGVRRGALWGGPRRPPRGGPPVVGGPLVKGPGPARRLPVHGPRSG